MPSREDVAYYLLIGLYAAGIVLCISLVANACGTPPHMNMVASPRCWPSNTLPPKTIGGCPDWNQRNI